MTRAFRKTFPQDWQGARRIGAAVQDAFPELTDPSCGWTLVPKREHVIAHSSPRASRDDGAKKDDRRGNRPWRWQGRELPESDGVLNGFARKYRKIRPGGYLHQHLDGVTPETGPEYETNVLDWVRY